MTPHLRTSGVHASRVGSVHRVAYVRGVRAIRRFTVRPVLPDALEPLSVLAGNLRWSWHPPTQDLFAEIDRGLWEEVHHDPVRLLASVGPQRLEEVARDEAFKGRLTHLHDELQRYLGEDRWYDRKAGDD